MYHVVQYRTFYSRKKVNSYGCRTVEWTLVDKERYFDTKEAAEKYADEIKRAAELLGVYPMPVSPNIREKL